ncbi:hypothetical protein K5X82_04985 [Halosquirtibacter xylanolyticus]|uniref:hypothetical protein n=1 Tax=Halosquirtibacter xylanolyticus TaxID=3374599 RepID=UPI003748EF67|nr:hypothetical protein K5X82_04985 [Prolixibacteraceae bacterium]
MTNFKTISIALIEYAYRKNILQALQLYYLMKPQKQIRLDTPTYQYCMKTLQVSYSTLQRRFNELTKLGFIKRHRSEYLTFIVQDEKHILPPYEIYLKGQLHWRPHYKITEFKIITITALLFHISILREIGYVNKGQCSNLRKQIMTHCKVHPNYGRIFVTRHFRIPSNYYAKALHVSLMQYYRYRKKAYEMTLLGIKFHDLKVNIPSQRLPNVRLHYKEAPYIATKNDGSYLRETTSIHFNLFISP